MVEISGGPGGVFNELNAPAPEIIFTISSDYSLPGPPLPSQFFQDITASLNSTIRGKLREYNLPSGSSLTTEAIKMYDGERFFLQAKKHASSSITPLTVFEYQISSSSGISSEDYGFWAVCQIQNNNTSSFQTPVTERVTDPSEDPLREFQGKNIVWDETNLYLNTNYLPLDTKYNDVNYQRWSESFSTLSGSITKLNDSQYEFYDGEFSGSQILVTNGELNEDCSDFKKPNYQFTDLYGIRFYDSDDEELSIFMSQYNRPTNGYMSIFNQYPVEIPPVYLFILTSNVSSTLENRDVIFSLESYGVPNNTLIPFTITGSNITASAPGDFEVPYDGYFNVFNNFGTQSISVRNDQITEGTETLTLFLDDFPSTSVDVNIADQGIGYLFSSFASRELHPITADTSSNWVGSTIEKTIIPVGGQVLNSAEFRILDEQGLSIRDPNASLTYNSFTNITNPNSSSFETTSDFNVVLSQDPANGNNIITPKITQGFQKYWRDDKKLFRANFTVTANNSTKTFNQDFQFRNNSPRYNPQIWSIPSFMASDFHTDDYESLYPTVSGFKRFSCATFFPDVGNNTHPYYYGQSTPSYLQTGDYWNCSDTQAGTIIIKRTKMNNIIEETSSGLRGWFANIHKDAITNGAAVDTNSDLEPYIFHIQETWGAIGVNSSPYNAIANPNDNAFSQTLSSGYYHSSPVPGNAAGVGSKEHWLEYNGTGQYWELHNKPGGFDGTNTYQNDPDLRPPDGDQNGDATGNNRGMKMYTYYIALRDNIYAGSSGTSTDPYIDDSYLTGLNTQYNETQLNTSPGNLSPWVLVLNLIIYKN
jgi:hypothetical protein